MGHRHDVLSTPTRLVNVACIMPASSIILPTFALSAPLKAKMVYATKCSLAF
jgi:hypothetical protein